ncbi:DUF4386 domain-containing protein [Chitinophaga deserti]|uniref:DUF4386 domain-containing protein n=1 Tax=Chitinophaga deserti TaxID=2164099 RepID=UPI000D6ABFF4|nr:DUF4386 domain-containing protein [Chitinophaga deserti]
MLNTQSNARLAGFLYLIVVITGILSLGYIPSQLEASGTYENNILLRWGILSSIICYLAFLLLPLILYRIFSPFNEPLSRLMVILAVVSVPIALVNLQHRFALLNGGNVKHHLEMYSYGLRIVSIFWGLWLLPFGLLVIKSRLLPRVLGYFLILGCIGYITRFTGLLMIPDFGNLPVAGYLTLPATIGEIGSCLWLLIIGVRRQTA